MTSSSLHRSGQDFRAFVQDSIAGQQRLHPVAPQAQNPPGQDQSLFARPGRAPDDRVAGATGRRTRFLRRYFRPGERPRERILAPPDATRRRRRKSLRRPRIGPMNWSRNSRPTSRPISSPPSRRSRWRRRRRRSFSCASPARPRMGLAWSCLARRPLHLCPAQLGAEAGGVALACWPPPASSSNGRIAAGGQASRLLRARRPGSRSPNPIRPMIWRRRNWRMKNSPMPRAATSTGGGREDS